MIHIKHGHIIIGDKVVRPRHGSVLVWAFNLLIFVISSSAPVHAGWLQPPIPNDHTNYDDDTHRLTVEASATSLALQTTFPTSRPQSLPDKNWGLDSATATRDSFSTYLPAVLYVAPELFTVDNFSDGETIRYRLPLLKGTAVRSTSVTITNGGSVVQVPVNDTRWRGFVLLHDGLNEIVITGNQGATTKLNLIYAPSNNQQSVRMVYILGSDSPGTFDAPIGTPNGLDAARRRLGLTGQVLQSMVAELLVERNLPRETFLLQEDSSGSVIVEVRRLPLTVEQIRDMSGEDLWYAIYELLGEDPNSYNTKSVAIIADCHTDMTTNISYACTALGGSNLALFGSNTLYSFPDNYSAIGQHFMDDTPVEGYLFPELGRAHEYWAAYTTSIGAILHELGHSLDLPHPSEPTPGDIMWRGFDYLNRLATTYEPHHGSVNPATDIMPYWSIEDAKALLDHDWIE